MKFKTLFSIAFFALLLSGCTATTVTGRNFEMSNIDQIEKGVSTKSDIRKLFGELKTIEVKMNNVEQWTFSYVRFDDDRVTHERKIHAKALIVVFHNGIVNTYDHAVKIEN